ncbi:MAG TPA: hypothetical protein VLJ59_19520 [Mycobacteriales bacterium]|nr:hypothetical protein [Mycobacteriales bacterium]
MFKRLAIALAAVAAILLGVPMTGASASTLIHTDSCPLGWHLGTDGTCWP